MNNKSKLEELYEMGAEFVHIEEKIYKQSDSFKECDFLKILSMLNVKLLRSAFGIRVSHINTAKDSLKLQLSDLHGTK